jgi:hypothetical protein
MFLRMCWVEKFFVEVEIEVEPEIEAEPEPGVETGARPGRGLER